MILIRVVIGVIAISIPAIQALECSIGTSIPDGNGGVIKTVMSQTCTTQCYATYSKLTSTPVGSIVGGCATGDACALANQGPIYFGNEWVEVKCCNSRDNCNSIDWDAGQYDWNTVTMPPATMAPTQQQQQPTTATTTTTPTSSNNPTTNPTNTPTKPSIGGNSNPTPSSSTTSPPTTTRVSSVNSANCLMMSPVMLVVVIGLSLIL